MKAIQKFAIERPVTTAMFYLFLILLGLIALKDLEINLLPDLEFPRLTIVTTFPNAAPQEVENLITKPVSEAVGTVNGIEKITSESLEGVSFVTLQFSWGTRIDFAAMEVREKVDLIRGILPEEASKSVVSKFDPSQAPIQEIVFFPPSDAKEKDLRHFLKTEVKGYMDRIDGVALVQFSGGYQKEIQIDVDQTLMNAHNVTLSEMQDAIETSNLNFPAGHIQVGSSDVLIRTLGEYKSLKDIGKTIVSRNDSNVSVKLIDLATVKNGYRERKGVARHNGKECVVVSLFKEAGKNTVDVSKNIRTEMQRINKQFTGDFSYEIVYDEARFVQQSIDNISNELVSGGVLAFLSLILILRNLGSPLILLTVLPISVITTFLLMYFRNLTINMMSLGGLSLGIGMLFDAGNVVLAAIERHIENGVPPKEAALRGANEVAGSITSAVLTTIIVFLPIIFLKGIVGVVFSEMALSITFSLSVSLLVSLTLIPMLSSLRKKNSKGFDFQKFRFFQRIAGLEEKMDLVYAEKLSIAIKNPKLLFRIIFFLIVLVVFLLPFVEREFIPKVDSGEFKIEIQNTKGSSLESTSEVAQNIEEILLKEPDIQHVISRIGYDEEQILTRKGGDVGTHQAQIRVVLKEIRKLSTKALVQKLRQKIQIREDIRVNFISGGDILSNLLSPESRAITLELHGNDLSTLSSIGERIKNDISKISGIVDTKTSLEEKAREYHIQYDEDKLGTFNLTHETLSQYLKTAIKGSVVTRLRVSDIEFDVRLRFRESDRKSKDTLDQMMVKLPKGEIIHLTQVVTISQNDGFTSILRSGQSRINRITADVEGKKQNEILDSLDSYIKSLKLPEGYKISFSGEKEGIEKSLKDLIFAFLLAVILIYMVLAGQFESLVFPLVMLGTIPLIMIGITPAMLLTGKSINISSFTGIILLVGIVVDNAALFYEYVEILEEEGRELQDAIVEAGKIVLRPIIMNNGTTLLGLLPVALELGEGTEFQSPMAIAVISGLITSVFLSLYLIPVLFFYLRKWQEKGSES